MNIATKPIMPIANMSGYNGSMIGPPHRMRTLSVFTMLADSLKDSWLTMIRASGAESEAVSRLRKDSSPPPVNHWMLNRPSVPFKVPEVTVMLKMYCRRSPCGKGKYWMVTVWPFCRYRLNGLAAE